LFIVDVELQVSTMPRIMGVAVRRGWDVNDWSDCSSRLFVCAAAQHKRRRPEQSLIGRSRRSTF